MTTSQVTQRRQTQTSLFALRVAAAKIRAKAPNWETFLHAFEQHANEITIPLMDPRTRATFDNWQASR